MIEIDKINERTFRVSVTDGTTTSHTVTVSPDYHQQLTGGRVPVEDLIRESFDFLLERESNTSILRSFDLPVISRYFPEYEGKMRSLLGG